MAKRQCLGGLVMVGLFVGCAKDVRPIYQPPSLAADQAVTIKGESGWFVDDVDGARLDDSHVAMTVPFAIVGGNDTRITPGPHRIRAVFNSNNTTGHCRFHYTFVAGHTYTLEPRSLLFNVALQMTDNTTNQVVYNNDDD